MTKSIKYDNTTIAGISFIVLASIAFVIWYIKRNKNKVVSTAKMYLNKEETSNNQSFKDKKFEVDMLDSGWFRGGEWCAFFAKMIMLKSLKGKKRELAQRYMSGSSQKTFENFQNLGSEYISKTPRIGSVVVWQSQQDKNKGHVGIVKKVFKDGFETIEGNVNKNGSSGIVTENRYNTAKSYSNNNLKLRGFITI